MDLIVLFLILNFQQKTGTTIRKKVDDIFRFILIAMKKIYKNMERVLKKIN